MRKSLGLFIAIFITFGMIAVAHAVIYEAVTAIILVLAPGFLSPVVSAVLLWICIALAISFIAATFISMKFNNGATRIIYKFAAVWTGFAIYFFFAAFIYGMLCMVPALTSSVLVSMTTAWVGIGLLAAAFITAVYGIFHAGAIQLTEISARLPGLPPAWKNRKAVWVSDLHLGQVRGKCFAKKVTERILSLSPDIVFIGGDLYDGAQVDAVAIIEPLRKLTGDADTSGGPRGKRVPLGVYFVMGNHEEFNERDTLRYAKAIRDIGIRILDDECVDVGGLNVIGVDHGHTENPKQFGAVLEKIRLSGNFNSGRPSILLKHEPRDLDAAAKAGISFQISGHTHQGQIFPVSLLTRFIFKGYDYGLKEFPVAGQTHGMQVYTSSGVGTWGLPLRVGTKSEIVLITFV